MTSGLNISVDQGLVQPVIQAEIQAAIVRELAKDNGNLIREVVARVLTQKVDNDGKVSSYGGSKAYMDWVCEQAIRSATKSALEAYIRDSEELLMEEIEKQIKKNGKEMAKIFVESLMGAIKTSWRFSVSIDLPDSGN